LDEGVPDRPPPTFDRATALACSPATLRQHWLEVVCECGRETKPPLRMIVERYRRERLTLADVLLRLRCQACGKPPRIVALVEDISRPPDAYPAARRPWRLVLLGD